MIRRMLPVMLLTALLLALLCLAPLCALAGDGEISGICWYNASTDGRYYEGDRTISGVQVSLYLLDGSGNETLVDRQTTPQSGLYAFTGLDAGEYLLRAKLPENHQFIYPQKEGSVMLPACGGTSESLPITLGAGERITDANIGVSRESCYIEAYVFVDANQNGGRSTTEAPLRYLPVTLYTELDGKLVSVAVVGTDQEGCATFWKLTPGVYRIGVNLPEPYIIGPLGEKINAWYNCIAPCDSASAISEPFTVQGSSSLGFGIGAVSTGDVAGSVWFDADMDGLQGMEEGGYAGATVFLSSEKAGVYRQAVTEADGAYAFDNLLPGEYTLRVELPEDAMFTLPDGDSLFTGGYSFAAECAVTVSDRQTTQMQAVGAMPVTRLNVFVYNDLNANGAFDAGEPPFAGAALEVIRGEETVAAAQSDEAGNALIPVLRGGEAELRLVLPAGQSLTVEGEDSDFTAPTATGDLTQPADLPHGVETSLRAGVTLAAAVSGTVFDDRDLSGVMGAEEKGLEGFIVQALNAAGDVVAQTTTDGEGRYAFRNLLPQEHVIRFLLEQAYVFTEYSESGAAVENRVVSQTAESGLSAPLSLQPGQSVENVSAGAFRSATVSGAVLLSTGVARLPVTGGMEGVLVQLLDEYGAPVAEVAPVHTDEDGLFYLKGALPGRYMVEYILPENAAFVRPETGAESVLSDVIALDIATDLTVPGLYAIHTASLAGVLYQDTDLNAAYGAGEPVLAGVYIALANTDLDILYETRTQDNGEYRFDGLRPGRYVLTLTLPDGLCFAWDVSSPLPPFAGAQGTAEFDLAPGEARDNSNIAAAHPASLNGTVYFDALNNSVRDEGDTPAPGITVTLKSVNGPQSYAMQTDENGVFSLDALVPGRYTLRVTLEGDCVPSDGNWATLIQGFWTSELSFAEGEAAAPAYPILRYASVSGSVWSMDGSLTGVAGRAVRLLHNGLLLAECESGEDGSFTFENLRPGVYALECDLPDESFRFARGVDAQERASLILAEEGSVPFTVPMGEKVTDCDIGLGAVGSLGDTAWLDENGNGLQDGDEPGLPEVHIALYQYGMLVAEAETDEFGRYLIEDLYPGVYTVRVTPPREVKPTVLRDDFPLVASVLPESDELEVEAEGIIVPSAGRNLNCDLGFVLRKEGKYPESLSAAPQTDWSFGGVRK